MTAQQKSREDIDKLYTKHYGKSSKAQIEKAKIIKATRGKAAIKAKKETDREIALRITQPKASGEAKTAGVGIDDQAKQTQPVSPAVVKEGTRAALMAEAQKRGIKYFRILTKQELTDILKPGADQKYIDIVTGHAQKRWKQGWGSKSKSGKTGIPNSPPIAEPAVA